MGNFRINFTALVLFSVFTGVFVFVAHFLLAMVPNITYRLVFAVVTFIVYLNILRFFIFSFYSLAANRTNETLGYIVMYCITFSVVALPFLVETRIVFEAPIIRAMIIGFATVLLTKYAVYMILGPWHDIRLRFREKFLVKNEDYNPLVSVVIPAWNEEFGVLDTVRSLLKSSYRNLEIIVINDGSTDGSDEVICNFLRAHMGSSDSDIKVRYRYQENTGKGGALNHGISIASGEIIVSIDADCYVEQNAIAEFVKLFRDPKVMAAVGNVKVGNRSNTVGVVQYLEFLFSFYFKRADALLGAIYIIGGAAGAFRREIFDQLGGYSTENITEDIELTVRIQDAGMKIEFASEAIVYTEGALDLASLIKQRLRWKRGRFQTFHQHRNLFLSLKPQHNKFLTWVTLPLSLFQEVQILLELPFLAFLYFYSMVNNDYSSFLTGIVVVSTMFWVQFMFYDKSTRNWSFVLLAPIGWLLFYLASYVEVVALLKSVEAYIFKKEVVWQRWNRKGVGDVAKTLN